MKKYKVEKHEANPSIRIRFTNSGNRPRYHLNDGEDFYVAEDMAELVPLVQSMSQAGDALIQTVCDAIENGEMNAAEFPRYCI